MRVLLVEDDKMIGEVFAEALTDEAYTVDWVKDGSQALTALHAQPYDMVLLDLGLPKVDGMTVLRTLRTEGNNVPVLILTARDEVSARIQGLDAGADDYVIKPFDLGEVFARMRVLIRRGQGKADNLLTFGKLSLDTTKKRALLDNAPLNLTAKEYTLLLSFMTHPDKVLSKADLEDRLYGFGMEVESNAVEFLIYGLRKKIGQNTIKNMRGLGWYLSHE
ncbi:response regulator transcription factor [Moraxella oblonga]|uniref:response regulator transcription factor n=1 Tax=Moraxella oblonga TaxID=200413 RepID=UPI00082A3016|nr:response regulator transcription factor [Moraxella oblonga]